MTAPATLAASAGVVAGVAVVAVLYVALVVLVIAGMWRCFTKAGRPGWAALIPFYNTYVLLKIAGKPGWWLILFFVPLVNIVVAVITYLAFSRAYGKGVGFGLGLMFLGFIFLPILGFGEARYLGPSGAPSVAPPSVRYRPSVDASPAPWIVSAIAAAVLIAAVVVYFVVLRPDQNRVVGAFTSTESAAVNAAAQEVTNTLSYRRAHFEADFQRALAGTTGAMKSDLQGKKSSIQSAMTKGKFDLSAQVTHKALVGPVSSGKQHGYEVIVTINGYRSTAMDAPSPNNLDVTVVRSGKKWLLAGITNIGTT